jgi:cytochrome c biogenesis protein CcmG/thiol:disulfide interchange protein DsbE
MFSPDARPGRQNVGVGVSRCGIPAVLAAALVLAACDKGPAGAASPAGDQHPLVGSPAPAFDLEAQSGGKRGSLAAAEGKVALVDFWATWCAPCKASFPKYEALARKYGDSVVVIGISEDDEADGIRDFAKETGATFTLAWDKDKSVASAYRPSSMPTSYIVDKNGLVRFVHTGFRNGDEIVLDRELKSLQ